MALTPDDIQRLAHLARLALSPEQQTLMLERLNGFFSTVTAMSAVDTSGIEPMAHPLAAVQDVQLRLAADVASEPDQRSANQQNAPAVEDGLFLVPKVIE